MTRFDKIMEDYAFCLDVEIELDFEGIYSEENCAQARKNWEVAQCWEYHNEVHEDYDWTAEHDRFEEEEDMWAAYESLALQD